jgi:hypothetical protein
MCWERCFQVEDTETERFREIYDDFYRMGRVSHNYLDRAKYQNRHNSKSIRVMKLFFCQNDPLIGESFWQKNSFITDILFELCLTYFLM